MGIGNSERVSIQISLLFEPVFYSLSDWMDAPNPDVSLWA